MLSRLRKILSGGMWALWALTAVIALAIFLFTQSSIRRSRDDSFNLLKIQGKTLLETLIESANNAITANTYFWESFIARISPIAQLTFTGFRADDALRMFEGEAKDITVLAVHKFDSRLLVGESAYNPDYTDAHEPSDIFYEAASELLSDSSLYQSLIFMPDSAAESASAIYLELDSTRTQGIGLLLSAPGLWEMESEVGIAALIERLGEATAVDYIIFQDLDGVVFSSIPVDSVAPIAVDTFLQTAFITDTVSSRIHTLQADTSLEFVAPFSSELYPEGLFRLGLSLDNYNRETAEFHQRMIYFGIILFLLAALLPLYLGLRRERARLGHTLARTQSLADSILGSMQSGALALRSDSSIELVNRRLHEMFAIDENLENAPDWRATALKDILPDNITSGDLQNGEFSSTINGEKKHFLYSTAKISEREGGVAIIIYDYTHQRELEEESARRARLAELGDLAAGVAHEIRNPLNAISLAAQRLDIEFSDKVGEGREQFSFFTSQIKGESKRLDNIVTRLLDLTRAPKEQLESAAIAAIIRDWAAFMRPEMERNKVALKLELDDSLTALAERNKLRQALGNLYRNSLEAFLSAENRAQNLEINITLARESDAVIISFTDNGPGVTGEAADKLFTPYYTTKTDGAGLGLAISYRVIGDMQGSLELDKNFLNGARFIISLKPAPSTASTSVT